MPIAAPTSAATLSVDRRPIGSRAPTFIVGEVGLLHEGSLGLAHAFVDAIAKAGAHAVKFQTHIAEAESTSAEPFRTRFSPQDVTRFDYWRRTAFTENEWAGLATHARERGLVFLSSPFSIEAVELLERVGVPGWKVGSGEVSNTPMIRRMAESGLPVILSSGMSSLAELDGAVSILRAADAPLAVLQCTSSYPCPPEQIGLNMLQILRDRYDVPVGLSDHSGTIYPSLAAAALGADVIEVHVTLSREMFGPDVRAAVTTEELRRLCEGATFIRTALAHPVDKDALSDELAPLRAIFTKSVVLREELPAGTVLEERHLAVKKPGTGIPARQLAEVVGRRLRRDLAADEPLRQEDLE
jgi:N,N'-diacetyllegionaminate synthase